MDMLFLVFLIMSTRAYLEYMNPRLDVDSFFSSKLVPNNESTYLGYKNPRLGRDSYLSYMDECRILYMLFSYDHYYNDKNYY
jgi:hypothetical protein